MPQSVRKPALQSYVISGGEPGRARLAVIARALAPTTKCGWPISPGYPLKP